MPQREKSLAAAAMISVSHRGKEERGGQRVGKCRGLLGDVGAVCNGSGGVVVPEPYVAPDRGGSGFKLLSSGADES